VAGRKVFLATTVYDSPDVSYTFSIARTREAMHKAGLPTAYHILAGNCHVDDARNSVVQAFLESDASELVFLDADVSWQPSQLIALCGFDCDVVGGVYPYRREGKDGMPVRSLPGSGLPKDGLVEVEGLPTGFLRIKRHVIERLAEGARKFSMGQVKDVPLLFERTLEAEGRLGGDINFCRKWRALGGKVFAAADLRLGHCGKSVLVDSLSASLRKQAGLTYRHAADEIRAGRATHELYEEAFKAYGNIWAADHPVLSIAVGLARSAEGPILEVGSGLSTVLMAAATDQTVWCLEHAPEYAAKTEAIARQAGVTNIAIALNPLKGGWYDLGADMASLPEEFALAFVDGPPRIFGDRMKFFGLLGDRARVILCDDADDAGYFAKVSAWAAERGSRVEHEGRAAVILPTEAAQAAAE
jgi:predicted O-methyltransferase YrrM